MYTPCSVLRGDPYELWIPQTACWVHPALCCSLHYVQEQRRKETGDVFVIVSSGPLDKCVAEDPRTPVLSVSSWDVQDIFNGSALKNVHAVSCIGRTAIELNVTPLNGMKQNNQPGPNRHIYNLQCTSKIRRTKLRKRESDEMKDKLRICCIFSRHTSDMKWFGEKSKRWLVRMQVPVGVRAQVPVKTFSSAVLPDSSVTLVWFLISLWFTFLKGISLPEGEMHSYKYGRPPTATAIQTR